MYAALHPFCDVATARSAATRNTAGHPQLVLATTILASSLAFIDGSVVNVGLSAIGHSLAADAVDHQRPPPSVKRSAFAWRDGRRSVWESASPRGRHRCVWVCLTRLRVCAEPDHAARRSGDPGRRCCNPFAE